MKAAIMKRKFNLDENEVSVRVKPTKTMRAGTRMAKISLVLMFTAAMFMCEGLLANQADAATLTKTYSFLSTSETWAGNAGTGTTDTYQAAAGNPAGALQSRISGRNVVNATAGWLITGITWESLGIPAGATITSVDGYYDWSCTEWTSGNAASASGDLVITDSVDGNATTLETGVTFGALTAWSTRNATAAVAIPAALQASSTSIKIKLLGNLQTLAVNGAAVARQMDNIVLVITYSAPPSAGNLLHTSVTTSSTKWAPNGWGVASGRYGAITCETCHVKTTTDIKRIKTSIASPNGTDVFPGGSTVTFTDAREGTSDFGDDTLGHMTSTKVCEVCHTYDASRTNGVQWHAYDMSAGGADLTHKNKTDCTSCHKHNKAFKASCDTCHGNPPTVSTLGGPNGLANDPVATGSITAGAHNAHVNTLSFSDCNNCHNGYTASGKMPQNGDITIGFSNFGSTTGSYSGQTTAKYNGSSGSGTMTCSTVYCHGSTINPVANPTWTGTAACGDCHKILATDPPTLGSHTRHAGSGAGQLGILCSDCHGARASQDGHVDGKIEWSINRSNARFGSSATYNSAQSGTINNIAPSATYQTCSNVYCHSSVQNNGGSNPPPTYGTPTWGGTVDCTTASCHGNPPLTGNHTKHLDASHASYDCTYCHNGAGKDTTNHADNQIDVSMNAFSGGSYATPNGAPGNGYTTCSSIYCHSSVQSSTGGSPPTYQTPSWGGVNPGCGGCHGNTSATLTTGSHTLHLTTGYVCADCHNGLQSGNTPSHANKQIELNLTNHGASATYSGDTTPQNGNFGTCNLTLCHGTSSPTWGANTANVSCTKCHGNPYSGAWNTTTYYKAAPGADAPVSGTGGGVDTAGQTGTYTSNVSNDNQVGAHKVHVSAPNAYSNPIACSECHNNVNFGSASFTGHMDGSYTLAWGDLAKHNSAVYAGGQNLTPSYAGSGGACSSTYCHGGGLFPEDGSPGSKATPTWANSGTLLAGTGGADCGKCHGNPPATNHGGVLANQCSTCHSNVIDGKTTAPFFTNLSLHINGLLEGGISNGGMLCYGCHSSYQTAMEDGTGKVGATRTSYYHHVLGGTAGDGEIAPNAGNYQTSTADVFCTSCHADHNYFNSDKGANLRTNIATASPQTVQRTDFITGGAPTYGICITCHSTSLTKDTANQKSDGTTSTPTISGVQFDGSSHNYGVLSSFGTSTYNANCVKCHNDDQTKDKQTSTAKFGLHFSNIRRILSPMGITAPTDPLEENFCYRCHSSSTDSGTPGGGPVKATAGTDYYGSQPMATPAEMISQNVTYPTGTVGASSTTTVINVSGTTGWTASQWNNYNLKMTSGALAGQARRITASSATAVTVTPAFATAPVSGVTFQIGGLHDMALRSGNHLAGEAAASGWMDGTVGKERHVECEDCHNPHAVKGSKSNASGTVASSLATSLTANGTPNWATDQWKGYIVNITTTGRGQTRYIASNTANTITITGNWAANPSVNDKFTIVTKVWEGGGVASAGAATTLTDSSQAWTASPSAGSWAPTGGPTYYVKTVSGTGAEQVRAIVSNTATALTVAAWNTVPAAGTGYVIYTPPKIAGVNAGLTNGVAPAIDTQGPVVGTTGTAANMRNTTYTAKTTITTQYELCLKCHSTWAYTAEPGPNVPSPYAQNSNYDIYGTTRTQTDVGKDFDPDNYAYHPLFAPGKYQPIRMGNPSANAVGQTIAYTTAWPNYTTGTASINLLTPKIVTLTGSALQAGVGAGWWIYLGAILPTNPQTANFASPQYGWWPIASMDSATQITLAVPFRHFSGGTGNLSGVPFRITKGYKSAFVDGWGPESLTTCTDCHNTTDNTGGATVAKARGPHGSANRWLLRFYEAQTVTGINGTVTTTTPGTPVGYTNFCLNCHSQLTYGNAAIASTYTAGANSTYGRVTHQAWNACIDNNGGGNFIQVNCTNCHAGSGLTVGTASVGTLHGNNMPLSGTAPSGFRFQNGASWAGKTMALGSTGCYVRATADAIHLCTRTHNATTGINYQY